MKICNYALFLVMIPIVSMSQIKLVEKVEKVDDSIVIPYEKYELDNGLTLIIHEDHSDPIVHVDVTYHVGSAREELKKSGFAHFFEHMMFQGSENVGNNEHFKIVNESGGSLNGTTNLDRTNYFETLPKNQLETALWLEADRMGFLLDSVTQQKFEIQRETVKNEKGQNYDNAPYARWIELNAESMYPYGHPYSWVTIGKLEDLDRVDVTDLKKFFLRWYGPNNATLTIGGDVDTKDVIQKVLKYFGSIPRGPEVKPLKLDPIKLDKNRYVSYYDKNIRFPALILNFPTVPMFHEDEPAIECLSEILGVGRESYFFKKFIMTQKSIQSSVFLNHNELSGEMVMFVLPYPGKSLSEFESEMRLAFEEFEKNGVSDVDIQKFKAKYESSAIYDLSTVSGKVTKLAHYQTFTGNPNFFQQEINRYSKVTKEDVMRVFKQYVKNQFSVVISVLAEENGVPAKPNNFEPKTEGENHFPTTDYEGLVYNKAKDSFDRSIRPTPEASPLVPAPQVYTSKMKNGIKVIGTVSDEIPTVAIELIINGGHLFDSYSPEKAGLAFLTASMLNESTENYTSSQLSEELEKLGSTINIMAQDNSTNISVKSLSKNVSETFKLLEEKLLHPKFNEADFSRVKRQQQEMLMAQSNQPFSIADNVFKKLVFGDDNILSTSPLGTENSIQNITLNDVQKFYETYYSPSISELVIVGNFDKEKMLNELSFLEKWKTVEVELPIFQRSEPIEKTKIYLINKEQTPQSEIRIGYLSHLPYVATGEFYETFLMNYNLGGAFNSRINLNLREDKGYTYGASCYFQGDDNPGPFTGKTSVRTDVTASALKEFMYEIKNYADNGINQSELEFMRKSIGQSEATQYESPWQKVHFLQNMLHYNLSNDFVKKQKQIIDNISINRINELAKKHLPYEKMCIVVVGDRAQIEPTLAELGYEIVNLDVNGNVIADKDE